jgi:HAD superfamily hydrolase (TIGR01457 family)
LGSLYEEYRGFIIDLDGVLYLLDSPIPGSADTVNRLAEMGLRFVFLTNNSASTPSQYVEKLEGFGVGIAPEQVVSSSHAVARYLEDEYDTSGRTAFVIGGDGLRGEIRSKGMRLLDDLEGRQAEFVFVGWDRAFDFEKLKTAVIAIRAGAVYIATNVDATYPTPEGLWPGAGSIVAAVTVGSGLEPYVAGKPNPLIVELALERLGLDASEALLVGDRLDTDIKAGLLAGVDTLLVLTGVSGREEIESSGIRPTHVLDDLSALID